MNLLLPIIISIINFIIMSSTLVLIAVLVATATYLLLTSLIRNARFRAFAKSQGAQDPMDLSGGFPYGLRDAIRVLRAESTGVDILDDLIGEGFALAPTFKCRIIDGSMTYLTADPANVQAMVATQFKDFETGELRYHQLKPLLGRSIFTSDNSFWEHSRAMFRPQFSRENINDLQSTERSCNALVQAIGDSGVDGWTEQVDVLPLLFNLTLDTATDFLFGESVNSQQAGTDARKQTGLADGASLTSGVAQLNSSKDFVQDLDTISRTLMLRTQLSNMYWLIDGFGFRRAIKRTAGFVDYFVDRAMQASKSEKPQVKKYNLLSELVKQTQDPEELRHQTLAILFVSSAHIVALAAVCC